MLQAKIFKCDEIAVNGQPITVAQLTVAVNAFNANGNAGLVMFDEYPGRAPMVQMDRVAGIATLHMDGQYVIATINLTDTPMGNIAKQLHEAGIPLQITPITSANPTARLGEPELQIRQLVIPANPAAPMSDTPLRKVQAWVEGIEYWPMFDLKEHK